MNFRTDMVEEEISNQEVEQELKEIGNSKVSKIVLTENNCKQFKKNPGIYYTITSDAIIKIDKNHEQDLKKALSMVLIEVFNHFGLKKEDKVFVVGLGNTEVTPDSLGPKVIDMINVTAHLIVHGKMDKNHQMVQALSPGVMGQTGIETSDIIKSVVNQIKPKLVIVIDALAAGAYERLNRSIQICTSGINPGSGIKNTRKEISKEVLGCDVLAIGVPTVVDLESIFSTMDLDPEFLQQHPDLNYMVTSKDVDQNIIDIAYIISGALNDLFS